MNAYGGDRLGESDEYEDWSDAVCKAFEVEECSAGTQANNGYVTDTLGDGNPATCCTVDMGDGNVDPPSSVSYGKVVAPVLPTPTSRPRGLENRCAPAGTRSRADECAARAAALAAGSKRDL